jgi:type IV secretion system protein VirB3
MIAREAIYKGATRPAMKFGIPLVPLVTLLGAAMLLVVWGGFLISWWTAAAVVVICIPMLGWMRVVTRRDEQRFRQMLLALKLRRHDHNHAFWQARSYAPALYRTSRESWHA